MNSVLLMEPFQKTTSSKSLVESLHSIQMTKPNVKTVTKSDLEEENKCTIISTNVCLDCNSEMKQDRRRSTKNKKTNTKEKIQKRKSAVIFRTEKQVLRNERERCRKARLNTAFKILRNSLPLSAIDECAQEIKYTQLEVLKLAATYISQLSNVLHTNYTT